MRPAPRKPPGLAVTARRGEAWPVSWASTLYFFCFCCVISVLSHVAGFAPAFRGAAHRGVLASAVPQREQMMLNWSPKLLVLSCTPQSANESSRGSTFASTLGHDACFSAPAPGRRGRAPLELRPHFLLNSALSTVVRSGFVKCLLVFCPHVLSNYVLS